MDITLVPITPQILNQRFIVKMLPIIIALNNGSRKEVLTAQNVLI